MSTAAIIYRRVLNGEPQQGHDLADFLTDIEAVAQAIQTRLQLFQGEWWENQNEGFPLFQKILGASGAAKSGEIVLLIQEVILGSPFVVSISNVVFANDISTRTFKYQANVQTQFGEVLVNFGGLS